MVHKKIFDELLKYRLTLTGKSWKTHSDFSEFSVLKTVLMENCILPIRVTTSTNLFSRINSLGVANLKSRNSSWRWSDLDFDPIIDSLTSLAMSEWWIRYWIRLNCHLMLFQLLIQGIKVSTQNRMNSHSYMYKNGR